MRSEAAARRMPARHHVEMHSGAHRSDDTSSPFTAGRSNNLSSAQFRGMYVRNPVRNAYNRFMKVKSPYRKPR